MRRAFTLIEVIVAAGIIAVVALGLLQVHGTNTKLIANMQNRYHAQEEFSLVLLNANDKWHNSNKSFYDFISQSIQIKNDDLRAWLKKQKIEYRHKEFSKVDLLSKQTKELAASLGDMDLDKIPELRLIINKISTSSTNNNSFGYTVTLE